MNIYINNMIPTCAKPVMHKHLQKGAKLSLLHAVVHFKYTKKSVQLKPDAILYLHGISRISTNVYNETPIQ